LLLFHAAVRDALGEVVANAHQAHGAMGITDAYPLQLFTRRAKVYQHALGTAAQFRAHLADLEASFVLPEAGEPLWGGFVQGPARPPGPAPSTPRGSGGGRPPAGAVAPAGVRHPPLPRSYSTGTVTASVVGPAFGM